MVEQSLRLDYATQGSEKRLHRAGLPRSAVGLQGGPSRRRTSLTITRDLRGSHVCTASDRGPKSTTGFSYTICGNAASQGGPSTESEPCSHQSTQIKLQMHVEEIVIYCFGYCISSYSIHGRLRSRHDWAAEWRTSTRTPITSQCDGRYNTNHPS